jgi:hypothetical protein
MPIKLTIAILSLRNIESVLVKILSEIYNLSSQIYFDNFEIHLEDINQQIKMNKLSHFCSIRSKFFKLYEMCFFLLAIRSSIKNSQDRIAK